MTLRSEWLLRDDATIRWALRQHIFKERHRSKDRIA